MSDTGSPCQDSGHVGHVDGVEQHLREIAKLDHDVELLKSALSHTEGVASANSVPQDEEQQVNHPLVFHHL